MSPNCDKEEKTNSRHHQGVSHRLASCFLDVLHTQALQKVAKYDGKERASHREPKGKNYTEKYPRKFWFVVRKQSLEQLHHPSLQLLLVVFLLCSIKISNDSAANYWANYKCI